MTTTPNELPRAIGFWGASAVMVGIIIGSGIFASPTDIAGVLGSPALILVLWAVGGVLSLCGALTYAELAAMYPQTGGVYVFLRETYGRGMAFVFGWTYLLLSKPFAAAGIAIIFSRHLNPLLDVDWDDRITTSVILLVLTIVNTFGLRLGSGVAGFLTAIKLAALLLIVILGVAVMRGSASNLAGTPSPLRDGEPVSLVSALAVALYLIMWTYDGWSDVGAIAGEVREPQRNLPRIYFAGTLVVTLLYVAVNAVYMWMVPLAEMRGQGTVAPIVAGRIVEGLGVAAHIGFVFVNLVILISTLGSTHGSIITGARISFAQARDGLLFRFLGRVEPRFKTPAVSLWVQLGLSLAALWYAQNFKDLASTFVFTMWIFYGLAAASIFILRARHPDAPRPFRCPGYPWVPALFTASAVAMTVLGLIESPVQNAIWVGVLLAGIPVYWSWTRRSVHTRCLPWLVALPLLCVGVMVAEGICAGVRQDWGQVAFVIGVAGPVVALMSLAAFYFGRRSWRAAYGAWIICYLALAALAVGALVQEVQYRQRAAAAEVRFAENLRAQSPSALQEFDAGLAALQSAPKGSEEHRQALHRFLDACHRAIPYLRGDDRRVIQMTVDFLTPAIDAGRLLWEAQQAFVDEGGIGVTSLRDAEDARMRIELAREVLAASERLCEAWHAADAKYERFAADVAAGASPPVSDMPRIPDPESVRAVAAFDDARRAQLLPGIDLLQILIDQWGRWSLEGDDVKFADSVDAQVVARFNELVRRNTEASEAILHLEREWKR